MLEQEDEGGQLTALRAELQAAARRIEQLEHAVESHGRIGQAVGVLMCRYGIAPEAAFAALSRVSQRHNLKLRGLAEAIIDTIASRERALPRELVDALGEILHAGERPDAARDATAPPAE